jgi:hypothetical protein
MKRSSPFSPLFQMVKRWETTMRNEVYNQYHSRIRDSSCNKEWSRGSEAEFYCYTSSFPAAEFKQIAIFINKKPLNKE